MTMKRRQKQGSQNNEVWLLTGAIGGVVMIVAALALLSRQNDSPSQAALDPHFEPEVTGAPRLEVVEDEVIDYGNVKLNNTITTIYTLRNVGDQPLVVSGEPRVELVEGC